MPDAFRCPREDEWGDPNREIEDTCQFLNYHEQERLSKWIGELKTVQQVRAMFASTFDDQFATKLDRRFKELNYDVYVFNAE